jgi:hypothetical protein
MRASVGAALVRTEYSGVCERERARLTTSSAERVLAAFKVGWRVSVSTAAGLLW